MAQQPVPLADLKMPSRAENARRKLTHLVFSRWCVWCGMARTPRPAHRAIRPFSGMAPQLLFAYCFLQNKSKGDDLITVLMSRTYQHVATVAVACDAKGEDTPADTWFATFNWHARLERCTYMSDQETQINSMARAALWIVSNTGIWEGAMPNTSAADESQSNGRAESADKDVEGHLGT